jgi:hypothetical protein
MEIPAYRSHSHEQRETLCFERSCNLLARCANGIGFISLKPLYSFIAEHRVKYEEALNLKNTLGRKHSKKCEWRG